MLKQRLLMAASHSGTSPSTGNLYGWGSNISGSTAQNVSTGNTLSPLAAVDTHTNWTQIVVSRSANGASPTGGAGVIGLQSNGTLWSWGPNGGGSGNGFIGQGNNSTTYLVPTQIGSASNWTSIAMTNTGGLAVRSDGTLWSWGVDTQGQLGQGGASVQVFVPTQVGVGTTWAQVFGCYTSTFLIDTSNKLWAMGANTGYQTGLGNSAGSTTTPTQIGSSDWAFVTGGNAGGIGVQTNGTLWSWGTDMAGELCQGISTSTTTPAQIGALTTWASAAFGGDGNGNNWSHFIKTDGTLWASGSNFGFQTGRNTSSGNLTTPTQVGVATTWTHVSCFNGPAGGFGGGIGMQSNGTIWSWGSNNVGQLGQGTSSGTVSVPTQIGLLNTWTMIARSQSGEEQSCMGTHS